LIDFYAGQGGRIANQSNAYREGVDFNLWTSYYVLVVKQRPTNVAGWLAACCVAD